MVGYITARRPVDVAHEVDVMLKEGCKKLILRCVGGGDMLDRERLGAARYVAGVQVDVELEGQASSNASLVVTAGAGVR